MAGCIPRELMEFEHLTTLILYRNFAITGELNALLDLHSKWFDQYMPVLGARRLNMPWVV